MTLAASLVNSGVKGLARLICRVHDQPLARVPSRGPLILAANHVNFLDAPIIVTHLQPRAVTALVKEETWDSPLMSYLFNIWEGIPIRRGEADLQAFQKALQALQEGKILGVSPEGTRSGTGVLGKGHPGVVLLALRSGAPILPLVYYGGERFHHNIRRLRRTDFFIKVGNAFTLRPVPSPISREVRQRMVDEIMYQMAALLPPAYRGVYSDLEAATQDYLVFAPGVQSNLPPPPLR